MIIKFKYPVLNAANALSKLGQSKVYRRKEGDEQNERIMREARSRVRT